MLIQLIVMAPLAELFMTKMGDRKLYIKFCRRAFFEDFGQIRKNGLSSNVFKFDMKRIKSIGYESNIKQIEEMLLLRLIRRSIYELAIKLLKPIENK